MAFIPSFVQIAVLRGGHPAHKDLAAGVDGASTAAITARRPTQKLCEKGYLQDLTSKRRYAPHIYQDTGQVVIKSLMQARLVRESNLEPPRLDRESNLDGQKVH